MDVRPVALHQSTDNPSILRPSRPRRTLLVTDMPSRLMATTDMAPEPGVMGRWVEARMARAVDPAVLYFSATTMAQMVRSSRNWPLSAVVCAQRTHVVRLRSWAQLSRGVATHLRREFVAFGIVSGVVVQQDVHWLGEHDHVSHHDVTVGAQYGISSAYHSQKEQLQIGWRQSRKKLLLLRLLIKAI